MMIQIRKGHLHQYRTSVLQNYIKLTSDINKIVFAENDWCLENLMQGHSEIDEIKYLFFANMQDKPQNFQEAISSADRENSMYENDVWEFTNRPAGKVIDARWIFTIKFDGNNKTRYEARLAAAREFKDQNQYDLSETYTPVTNTHDLRS